MSSPAVYDAFEARLRAAWAATPLAFENENWQAYAEATSPFVFVEIYGDTLDQETMGAPGANMWLERGSTYMHVMTPSGQGSRQARIWANDLLNLFREQPIVTDPSNGETLRMVEMSLGAGQPGEDVPNYWAFTATIHWYRYDITSLPAP